MIARVYKKGENTYEVYPAEKVKVKIPEKADGRHLDFDIYYAKTKNFDVVFLEGLGVIKEGSSATLEAVNKDC